MARRLPQVGLPILAPLPPATTVDQERVGIERLIPRHLGVLATMLRRSPLFAAFLFVAFTCGAARADDWMFRGSAYSYSPRSGQEFGANRFTRGPYYSPQYGGYYRGGYRNLHGGVGGWGGGWGGWGGSWDYSNHYETWWQTGEMWTY